jgi:hypothetical protein
MFKKPQHFSIYGVALDLKKFIEKFNKEDLQNFMQNNKLNYNADYFKTLLEFHNKNIKVIINGIYSLLIYPGDYVQFCNDISDGKILLTLSYTINIEVGRDNKNNNIYIKDENGNFRIIENHGNWSTHESCNSKTVNRLYVTENPGHYVPLIKDNDGNFKIVDIKQNLGDEYICGAQ